MFYCPTPQNSQDFQPQIPKIFNFEVIFPYIILLNNIILRSVKYRASRGTLLRSARRPCSRKRQHRLPFPTPYWYWLICLYFSPTSNSSLNFSILSGFSSPALTSFLCCFTQFSISCSSIRCFDGFLLFSSMNLFTSLYLINQRVS